MRFFEFCIGWSFSFYINAIGRQGVSRTWEQAMKIFYFVLCVGLVGLRSAGAESDGGGHEATWGLVVHEWGTFTGFAGSNGVHLPFETTIGSDLPAFVDNRQGARFSIEPKTAG